MMRIKSGSRVLFCRENSGSILVERDLGIMIANDLKWVHQIEKAVQTAKAIISQIRNQLTSCYLILPKLLIRFLMKNFF